MKGALAFWALYNERLLLAVMFTLVLCFAGCTNAGASGEFQEPKVYRDSATGCQYLTTVRDSGLTPRMSTGGGQICGERK